MGVSELATRQVEQSVTFFRFPDLVLCGKSLHFSVRPEGHLSFKLFWDKKLPHMMLPAGKISQLQCQPSSSVIIAASSYPKIWIVLRQYGNVLVLT